MTHRKDIVAVDGSETLEHALQFMLDERFTRFPVYEENIDDIIGTIHLRDAMKYYLNKELRPVKVKELKDCLREVSFIPETKGLSRLFKQMNTEKNHLFIVLDEYGQTAGIVAMEDIIEENRREQFLTNMMKKKHCTSGRKMEPILLREK